MVYQRLFKALFRIQLKWLILDRLITNHWRWPSGMSFLSRTMSLFTISLLDRRKFLNLNWLSLEDKEIILTLWMSHITRTNMLPTIHLSKQDWSKWITRSSSVTQDSAKMQTSESEHSETISMLLTDNLEVYTYTASRTSNGTTADLMILALNEKFIIDI